ncbi:unnamed protein product [Didymodactylos carnosus]|uniref:Uncharacterized protein n=1 Tax=Didymodactylos carnosus TaxID=1234261 RepID=A0A814GYZ8_9BILA|nr:unnamed protein product [Didymodactylos carnosus]CAF1365279.1 unnamed protein product [Didymodactylos carnosus]CAF3774191.1 unnamed protein product [Didymodactylos carnosus]CAF4174812.1 unnamed protein product [Didymodactylos carnosus]
MEASVSPQFFTQSLRTKKTRPHLQLPKYREMKVEDGQWVEKNDILILQNNLNLYPGENTVIEYDYTVKAAIPGFTVVSTEVVKPYPHSPLYRYVASGNTVKRNFIHVIPPKREAKFKLIEEL